MKFTEKAIQLYSKLDALRPLSKEDEARIMQKFRLDWNYHSNHLEGNSLTYGETKALILFGLTAQGKPLKDHFEITGHDEAVKWVEDIVKDERPLTESFIRELHKLLLKESYKSPTITPSGIPAQKVVKVGVYKTKPNHVLTKTGEIFRFATPEETPVLMDNLIQWYRKKLEEHDTNPILLAAEFHYKFIRIHPFDDGNGRTARILMNFILMRFGFPPVIIKTEDKENYFSVLQQADAGILEPFLEYIAENLVRSLEIMISGAEGGSVEEKGDFEKKMALLEQKFKQTRTEPQDSALIYSLYNRFIGKLFEEFLEKSTAFNTFYSNAKNSFHTDDNETELSWRYKIKDTYESIEKRKNTESIEIKSSFEGLKSGGYEDVGFTAGIEIIFYQEGYKVTVQGMEFEKKYNEILSEKEISTLINFEMNRHHKFIENILQEIKNKS